MSRFSVLLLMVILVATVSCNSKKVDPVSARQRAMGPVIADGFKVQHRAISDKVEVPGSLLPFEETQIRAEIGGRIVQLNINEGSIVNRGTLLVKLFDKDLQAQLRKLEVQLQIKIKTEERNAELLKINGISQQDYDLSSLDVDNLKADIEAVQISISKTGSAPLTPVK